MALNEVRAALGPAARQLARHGQAHDAGADDDVVHLGVRQLIGAGGERSSARAPSDERIERRRGGARRCRLTMRGAAVQCADTRRRLEERRPRAQAAGGAPRQALHRGDAVAAQLPVRLLLRRGAQSDARRGAAAALKQIPERTEACGALRLRDGSERRRALRVAGGGMGSSRAVPDRARRGGRPRAEGEPRCARPRARAQAPRSRVTALAGRELAQRTRALHRQQPRLLTARRAAPSPLAPAVARSRPTSTVGHSCRSGKACPCGEGSSMGMLGASEAVSTRRYRE